MVTSIELGKLKELALYEPGADYDDTLSGLMASVSRCLLARRVSLMLLDTDGDQGQKLKLMALHGDLPKAAWDERPAPGQGIAARVLADGHALHIENIDATSLKSAKRHPGESPDFIVCPVTIAGQLAGVLNISDRIAGHAFTRDNLAQAELAAVLVGRAIQLFRLQGLLDSSFAKMAMALEGVSDSRSFMTISVHEPQKVAKILAKAFYKEMHRCGFTANQILHAAGETISALSDSINRHKQRLNRRD